MGMKCLTATFLLSALCLCTCLSTSHSCGEDPMTYVRWLAKLNALSPKEILVIVRRDYNQLFSKLSREIRGYNNCIKLAELTHVRKRVFSKQTDRQLPFPYQSTSWISTLGDALNVRERKAILLHSLSSFPREYSATNIYTTPQEVEGTATDGTRAATPYAIFKPDMPENDQSVNVMAETSAVTSTLPDNRLSLLQHIVAMLNAQKMGNTDKEKI